jgi:hypothetical protein
VISDIEASQLASLLLDMFPAPIGDAIISSDSLSSKLSIPRATSTAFSTSGPEFNRDLMHESIRRVLARDPNVSLTDLSGASWQLDSEGDEDWTVGFSQGERTIRLPGNWMLSPDVSVRVEKFQAEAHRYNIKLGSAEELLDALRNRMWTGKEASSYSRMVEDTPIGQLKKVSSLLKRGVFHVSDIVPSTINYYENLVGPCSNAASLLEFAVGPSATHIDELIQWRSEERLPLLFLLAGHPGLAPCVDLSDVSNEEFANALICTLQWGDTYSKLGALAVALQTYSRWKDIEQSVRFLTEAVVDGNIVNEAVAGYALTSTLFVLVYGELSRTKVLSTHPPFWRRLAAMAHASLIERAINRERMTLNGIKGWAYDQMAPAFLMQCYCDLRLEPRWLPDYIEPQQLRNDSIGRLAGLVDLYKDKLIATDLEDFFFAEDSRLKQALCFPQAFYPSLVEGGQAPLSTIPERYLVRLRDEFSQLGTCADASIFAGLVNGAQVFGLETEHAVLAADVLKVARSRLAQQCAPEELELVLVGLASVAATTRSVELAEEVRLLSRIARQQVTKPNPLEEFRAAFTSGAAIQEEQAWAAFVGGWLTEIAYSIHDRALVPPLIQYLSTVCWIEPVLLKHLSRAIAALRCV